MRLISLYIIIFCVTYLESCYFSELSGSILGCEHDGKEVHVDLDKNDTIDTGSMCIVENQQGVQRIHCDDTHWKIQQAVYDNPNKQIRRKRGWGRFFRSVGDFFVGAVKCIASLFTRCVFGDRRPRDKTPPTITCLPPEVFVTAKPFLYVAKATWEKPMAVDETDGSIIPRRRSGYERGENFPEGKTTVTYEAKDRSGNRASCDIFVHVTVVRCDPPKRMNNSFFQCYPVTDHINGGTCRFGCYEGFDLQGGPDRIYCKDNGQWSASQPICKPWKCPGLPQIEKAGKPKCTNGSNFRSICSYNCGSGFDMPPNVSKSLVCDKTKSWRMFGTPKCVDVEPPTFKPGTCPSIVIVGTDTGLNSTKVSWSLPEVMDNSNNAEIDSITVYSPGERLTTGIYSVAYRARDAAGNIGVNNCSFKVIVREIRCSKLYPTPYLHIDCPNGYRAGAVCNISCDPGKILIGSNNVGCKRNLTHLYGVWNWKGKVQSSCINGRACVAIQPPENGAVVCDNWEGGHFCQIQCKNGTQMTSVSLEKLYVCQSQKGEWSAEPPKEKTCRTVRSHQSSHHLGITVYYYFDGDCTDPETRQQIASNFIEILKSSLFQAETCPNSIECNRDNVHISCGESSRKKRNVDYDFILVLTAKLPVFLYDNESLYTADGRYSELVDGVQDALTNNIKAIFGNTRVLQKEFVTQGLQLVCPEGSVKSKHSLDCIDCPEGTFYTIRSDHSTCEVCRKGTFQNKAAQLSCLHCNPGKTTQSVGATSSHDCQDACVPGTYSSDGLFPCTPCEQGYYQASFGQTFCDSCRGSMSTLTFGAASASDCEEFDILLLDENESEIQLTLQNNVTIKEFSLGFWFRSSGTSNMSLDRFPTITLTINNNNARWVWEGLRNAKQKGSIGSTVNFGLRDTRWHYITLYNSAKCLVSVTIDGMVLSVEDVIGNCTDIIFNTVSIASDKETSGSISQLNIWRGKHQTGHMHRCFTSDIGDVFHWKAIEEAKISGAYIDIPSQCDDFDNCVSSPCIHGVCTDVLHGFTCKCDTGYFGTKCEINNDDCEANICMNNATCIDGITDYICSCPSNFTGEYCEIEMVDGKWSDWGSWSECSTTCGDGEKNRKRLCNSPSPDNGGEDCHGNMFNFTDCKSRECPVCPEISAPVNGSLNCATDTYNINCTLSCDDGFEFDIEPLPLYYCGPHTFQEWNYQTDINPERRLPRCVEIKMPLEMSVIYSAHYEDLFCANQDFEDLAIEQIDLTVNSVLSNVACLTKNTCSLNFFNIIECDSNNKDRRRRFTGTTAGFSLQLKTNPAIENANETMQDLEDAFRTIQNAAGSGDLTVHVLDDDYKLRSNSTEIKGDINCGSGQTRVIFYCVPCGKGSYLNEDVCEPCPVGTYQELEGQNSCENCPKGKSTIGIRSTVLTECTVNVPVTDDFAGKVTGVIVGVLCALVVIIVVVFMYRRYRSKKSKTIVIEQIDINMFAKSGPNSNFEIGRRGQTYGRYESTSLTCDSVLPQISQVDSEN